MADSVSLSQRGVVSPLNLVRTGHPVDFGLRNFQHLLAREGLSEIAHLSVAEQLSYLLEERRYLQRELLDISSRSVICDQSVTDIHKMFEKQKDDYEAELHDQHRAMLGVKEQIERVHQKELKQLENEKRNMENEFNLANQKIGALKEVLDQLEGQGRITVEAKCKCKEKIKTAEERCGNLQSQLKEQQHLIYQLKDKISVLEKLNKQIELDNETLSYKLSEVLAQYDDLEDQLRKEKITSRRGSVVRQNSDSPPRVIHSILDNKISAAHHELSLVSQIKKLHFQVSKTQEDLVSSNKKNEDLMLKYQQRKQRHRERIHKIRGEMDVQYREWQNRLSTMLHTKTLAEEALLKETEWRAKIERDCSRLMAEKRQLLIKLVDCEDKSLKTLEPA